MVAKRLSWGISVSLVASSVFASCGGWRASDEERVVLQQGALSATTATITLKTPAKVPTTSVVLAANGTLIINAGTTVTGPGTGVGTPTVVTNMGTTGTRVGAIGSTTEPDSIVNGDLWSASGLDLRDRVHVQGTAHATSISKGNGVSVGAVDAAPALNPPTVTQWTVSLPASGAAVSISPGQTGSRAPGSYAGVQVFAGATLSLSTGTYYMDTLLLEPGAIVRLDQTKGPVVIYVRTTLQLRGTFSSTTGAFPDVLLAYLGTTDVSAETPFTGTLLVPQARLFLGSISPGHVGAFFAKNIEVGPHTKVTFHAPHPLLIASGLPVKSCIDSVVPDLGLSGKAREVQFQSDITRYCTGRDFGPCEAAVVARLNVDFFSIASQLYREVITPAQYVAILNDRHGKLKSLRGNETQACAIIQGDGDQDFVPNGKDSCLNSPDLSPTLANGCPNTVLPAAPSITDMRKVFGGMAISGDPRCAKAPSPMIPAPLGAWRSPPDPAAGKAIWVSRDKDVSGCPMWYQLEVELTDGLGARRVLFKPAEDTTLSWITRPAGAVQFRLATADPTDRGAWASYAVYTGRYRARAINGAGRRSAWSNWFTPGTEDCLAGLCPDGRVP